MKIVAIEGPCFAGKSTLAAALAGRLGASVVILPDYSDFATEGERPVLPARSQHEELAALDFYLRIERTRWRTVPIEGSPLVIQDRSVHTLLAHIYANDQRTGDDSFSSARIQVEGVGPPEADVILFLDVGDAELHARYRRIPNRLPALLTSSTYIRSFRDYFFDSQTRPHGVVILDATGSARSVTENAVAVLHRAGIC